MKLVFPINYNHVPISSMCFFLFEYQTINIIHLRKMRINIRFDKSKKSLLFLTDHCLIPSFFLSVIMSSFLDLPVEIYFRILKYVDKSALLNCLLVKKTHVIAARMLQQDIVLSKRGRKIYQALEKNVIVGNNVLSLTLVDQWKEIDNISKDQAAYLFKCTPNLRTIHFSPVRGRYCRYLGYLWNIEKESLSKHIQEVRLVHDSHVCTSIYNQFFKVNLKFSETITHLRIHCFPNQEFFNTRDKYKNYLSKFVSLKYLAIYKDSYLDTNTQVSAGALDLISVLAACPKLVGFTLGFLYCTEKERPWSCQDLEAACYQTDNKLLGNQKEMNGNLQCLDLSVDSITRADIMYIIQHTPVVSSFKLVLRHDTLSDFIRDYGLTLMQQFINRIVCYHSLVIDMLIAPRTTMTIQKFKSEIQFVLPGKKMLNFKTYRPYELEEMLRYINPNQSLIDQVTDIRLSYIDVDNDLFRTIIEVAPCVRSLEVVNEKISWDEHNNTIIDLGCAGNLEKFSLTFFDTNFNSNHIICVKVELSQEYTVLYTCNRKKKQTEFQETPVNFINLYNRKESKTCSIITIQCHKVEEVFICVEAYVNRYRKKIALNQLVTKII